jgi:uncharacterized protein (DUF433 family)
MRKFERIRVEKGQAYIRDTNITVSEIVKKVVHEQTSAQVLSEYPLLDSDDIEEVMAYAVSDLIETVAMWRNTGLGPVSTLAGFSKIFADNSDITEEQKKQFNAIMYRSSRQAVAAWWNFSSWVYETYRDEKDYYHQTSIDSLVKEVLQELPEYDPTAQVIWNVAEDLPDIRTDYNLPSAIVNILTDRTSIWLNTESTFEISSENNRFVSFRVLRQFEYEEHGDLSHEHILGWRSSPLSLAALIINKHGSELQITTSDDGIIFRFSLPIWDANS